MVGVLPTSVGVQTVTRVRVQLRVFGVLLTPVGGPIDAGRDLGPFGDPVGVELYAGL